MVRLSDGRAVLPRVGGGAFAVLLGTLAINLGVARWQARAAERLGSTLLASDARHTRADCYVTAGVLLATALTWLGQPCAPNPCTGAMPQVAFSNAGTCTGSEIESKLGIGAAPGDRRVEDGL